MRPAARKTEADAKRRADEEESKATQEAEARGKAERKEKEKDKREPPFAQPKQERLQETGAETPTPGEAPVVQELRRRKVALAIGIPLLVAVALAAAAAVIISGKPSNTTATSTSDERTLQEEAKARWSDVQNQYRRRADLIPNLVATVQGVAPQEKSVLTAVVEARAKATQITVNASDLTDPEKLKAFQDAQAQLTDALGRLLAVSKNYPRLKVDAFLALQSQLEGTENRILAARRDYNDAVRAYNTALRTSTFSSDKPMIEFTGGG